jgi:RNA polymerase sigma-70 factor (ECF subfamily)
MTPLPDLAATDELEPLLVAMRPRLHRYASRMVGSVIDGEDVLQDALVKAVEARPLAGAISNPEGWLFRITHNTAPPQPAGSDPIGGGGGDDGRPG